MPCIFCSIVSGDSPAKVWHRDDLVTAFSDTHPIASTHVLIVPNRHIASLNELLPEDGPLMGHMVMVAKELAAQAGLASRGYRLILNTGPDGGQTIFHLHLHLIGGRLARFALK